MKACIDLDGTLWITAQNTTEIFTLLAWLKNQREVYKIPPENKLFDNIDIDFDIESNKYVEE
jgi:hypothetical protein